MRKLLTVLIMAVMAIYTLAVTFMTLMAVRTAYPYTPIDSGWDVTIQGQEFENIALTGMQEAGVPEVREGDEIVLRRIVPDSGEVPFPTIAIKLRYCAYAAFLDGEPVDSERLEDLAQGKFIGSKYYFIQLPRGSEGRELEIKLHVTRDDAFRYIATPHYGNYDDVAHMFLHEHIFPFISGVYLFVFGLLFLVISLFFVARVPEIRVTMVSALLCIALSAWTLSKYDLLNLFFYVTDKTLVEYVSLYAIPSLILAIIWVTGNYTSKRLYFLYTAPLYLAVAWNLFGALLGAFPINRFRILYYIGTGIAALAALMETARTFRNRPETANQIQMVSVSLLNILLVLEVIVYFSEQRNPWVLEHLGGRVMPAGGLMYSLGQIMNFFVFITRSYVRRAEAASLRRMAYEDILTGLPNRASYDREAKRLDEEGPSYCMISLDLNGLKETNDTLGHAYGDALLAQFGKTLRAVFGDIGFCSRIGGDEFLVVIRGATREKNKEDIEARLKDLEERLWAQDRAESHIIHSVAFGYAFSDERPGAHAHDIFLIADSRMYDLKRIQHDLIYKAMKEEQHEVRNETK